MAMAYSELFFISKLWPDFNPNDLEKVIKKYRKRKRNFGAYNFEKEFKNRAWTSFVLLFLLF